TSKNCSQRENVIEQARNRLYVSVEFDFTPAETQLKNTIDIVDCKLPDDFDASASVEPCCISDKQKNSLCKRYSNYGFCHTKDCSYIHDVDILLSLEEQKQAKIRERRKRRYDYQSKFSESASIDGWSDRGSVSSSTEERTAMKDSFLMDILKQGEVKKTSVNLSEPTNLSQSVTGSHRAGVDSFMTGFAVVFMQRMNLLRAGNFDPKCGNRIVLSGKMTPLVICKSDYIKAADDHASKWIDIERERNRRVQLGIQVVTKDLFCSNP
ncbi:unnamed protein product, partial [Onchocerca flexuosa]|uniref:C3H1-type domain-containing protein n=1 Tax=Onchocerca flexuosa TaxID=387005 RepID=A0A183HYI3_9BILA